MYHTHNYLPLTGGTLTNRLDITAGGMSVVGTLDVDKINIATELNVLNGDINTTKNLDVAGNADIHGEANIEGGLNVLASDAYMAQDLNVVGTIYGNVVGTINGLQITQITQTEYDALATKDSSTIYLIVE